MTDDKKRKPKLVRGRDFDAWMWRFGDGTFRGDAYEKPPSSYEAGGGKYVRVKFVEVKESRP